MGWGVGRAPGMVVYSLLGCVVALKKVMEFMVMGFLSGKLHIIIGILEGLGLIYAIFIPISYTLKCIAPICYVRSFRF